MDSLDQRPGIRPFVLVIEVIQIQNKLLSLASQSQIINQQYDSCLFTYLLVTQLPTVHISKVESSRFDIFLSLDLSLNFFSHL